MLPLIQGRLVWYDLLSKNQCYCKSIKHNLFCQTKWYGGEKTNDIKRHLFLRIAYTKIFDTSNKFCGVFGGEIRFAK